MVADGNIDVAKVYIISGNGLDLIQRYDKRPMNSHELVLWKNFFHIFQRGKR